MLSSIFERARRLVGAGGLRTAAKPVLPDPNAYIRAVATPFAGVETSDSGLLKDDSVYRVYNLYRDMLLGAGWRFEGGDAEAVDALMEGVVSAKGFDDMLYEMAAAPFQRMAVIEIVWNFGRDVWLPRRYRVVPIEDVSLALDEQGEVEHVNVTTSAGLQQIPTTNMVVYRWRPTFAEPLGRSVYQHIKEPVEYKRTTDKAMISYAQRWGVPSIVGFYAPGQNRADQTKFLAAIRSLQNASAAILPIKPSRDAPDVLQLLEAKGEGSAISAVMEMNKGFEKRIAGAVLGSILAVYESDYGTRAQAQTHLEVLRSVIEAAQAPLEEAINAQLVEPVLAYNRGAADVRFVLNSPNLNDLEKLGNMVADLAQAGLIDPMQDAKVIRTMFGIDTPDGWLPPGAPYVGDVPRGAPDPVSGEQRWTVGR